MAGLRQSYSFSFLKSTKSNDYKLKEKSLVKMKQRNAKISIYKLFLYPPNDVKSRPNKPRANTCLLEH